MTKHNTTLYIVRLASFSFQSNHFRMMRVRNILDNRRFTIMSNSANGSLCDVMEL
jgi:hypothetical protein